MPKPPYIELQCARGPVRIPIVYEDRSVLVIDKPAGWLVVPADWSRTGRNLQRAIEESIARGDFWARSRNLKFLRYVHRLDAETSGLLMMVKSRGAIRVYSALFERRQVRKLYLAVVQGLVRQTEWICDLPLSEQTGARPRVMVDRRHGRPALTRFRVLDRVTHPELGRLTVLLAEPETGRTHQIRVHLAAVGHPVVGDRLYGGAGAAGKDPDVFGLRAVGLDYEDPFTHRHVRIRAPVDGFLRQFGIASTSIPGEPRGSSGEAFQSPVT